MATVRQDKHKNRIMVYNLIPGLFWSAVNLIPLYIFCRNFMPLQWIVVFSMVSLFAALLRHTFLEKIQIGKTVRIYKFIGVPFLNNFTQNGAFVNTLIRKKYPGYKVLSRTKQSVESLLKQTFLFEKFHLVLFVFFILATGYAFFKNHFIWVLVLLVTNTIYNIYPILLQQYLRIRLLRLKRAQTK